MSEVEQEEQTEPETPAEPVEPDSEPDEEDAELEPEPEPEPEPELDEPRDEVEAEAIYKRLDTRGANYVKSIGEILQGSGVPVVICEMCADAYPGIRWEKPGDELHAKLVEVVVEAEQGAPLKDDPNTETCAACDGFGIVKLPSHVPENQMRMCRACNGAGYRELNPQSGTPQAPEPTTENGTHDAHPGVPTDDPILADYVARGYYIVPPVKVEAPAA
jgi:hypothetical protein